MPKLSENNTNSLKYMGTFFTAAGIEFLTREGALVFSQQNTGDGSVNPVDAALTVTGLGIAMLGCCFNVGANWFGDNTLIAGCASLVPQALLATSGALMAEAAYQGREENISKTSVFCALGLFSGLTGVYIAKKQNDSLDHSEARRLLKGTP